MFHKVSLFLLIFPCFLANSQLKKINSLNSKAEKAYETHAFSDAKELYLKLVEIDEKRPDYFFKLGKIAAAQRNENEAVSNFEKVVKLAASEGKFSEAHSYLGLRELKKGNYLYAKELLSFALEHTPSFTMNYHSLMKKIEECNMGIEAQKNALLIHPARLPDIINSRAKQYFPVFTADNESLFFTAIESNGDENIYYSIYKDGLFEKPMLIDNNINSSFNEGTCSVSADGRTMVFTSCEGRDSFGSCDLFITTKIGNSWGTPKNLGRNINSPNWESQPSLSSDGKLLFFSSERPEGFGKKDIWVSQLTSENQWTKAVNLGNKINTIRDDISPFIHANGKTLFYSSDGLKSFGGFDIYLVDINDGYLNKPENIGYPINNSKDQISLFITADGKKAYYAEDNKSQIEIYTFDIPKEIASKFKKINYLKGRVINKKDKEPITANIDIIDLKSQKIVLTTTSDSLNGNYLAVLPHGYKYALHISKEGFMFSSFNFDFTESKTADGKEIDIQLEPIEKEVDIVLSNIFFDSGISSLREDSFFELNKIRDILKNNPTIKAEIKGHTDDIGNDEANMELSKQRAQAVVNYLSEKGINENRLIPLGLGETSPLFLNDSEEHRQLNRRIEFRIK